MRINNSNWGDKKEMVIYQFCAEVTLDLILMTIENYLKVQV